MNVRILVVDDDEALQRAIKRAAEAAGYEVAQTSDGRDALTLAAKEKFDLILLDINMPAMDGRDVLSRLKGNTETSSIPVLVFSSRSGQLDRHVALELGAEDFVEKPMDGRLLMGKIGRLIEAARARTGGTA
jgi:DNA-binding response OmpR family regulator